MFTHPYLASALVSERQPDRLAWAVQQRLARQCRPLARARRTGQPEAAPFPPARPPCGAGAMKHPAAPAATM